MFIDIAKIKIVSGKGGDGKVGFHREKYVAAGGPAAKAGIREGDIILKVAGSETNSVAELRSVVDGQPVGSKVDVVIQRGDKTVTVKVLLEEMPAQ